MVETEFQMTVHYVTGKVAQSIDAQLGERDLAVLGSILALRFASGDQLTRMHFADGSARAARRALLRLVRLDVLIRLPRTVGGVRAGSAGFIYQLGISGQRIALQRGWLPERRRTSGVPGNLFVSHALQVAELHTQLVEMERQGRIELLEAQAEPACWRRHGQHSILKPDSYLRLGVGDFEDSYFIEVDMGTEGGRAIETKLKQYADYAATGLEQAERGVFPKVLWTAPDISRVKVIEDRVKRLPRSARELFAVELFTDAVAVMADGVANR
jgi:Replication-relaxation